MKKILLVDDDAVVRSIYSRKLEQGGFEVALAEDGLQAMQRLDGFTPDLVLLDLMMPKFSGENVLRFIRSRPQLAKLPVVILTNAFMSEQARIVSVLGVKRAVVKADCTPEKMLEIARQILGVTPAPAATPSAAAATPLAEDFSPAREQFLEDAGSQIGDLRDLCKELKLDPEAAVREGKLDEICRQTHHFTVAAGLAGSHHLALLAGVLEALLTELVEKPQLVSNSIVRMVVATVEYLALLLEDARTVRRAESMTGEVLVVDDDPLALRIAEAALSRAQLSVVTTENPLTALDLLTQTRFDLLLLDIEMPHLNGIELGRKIRCLPGYEQTPVIYVTAHSDFESRARSILAGGKDLIPKPIFPMELAVKAVTHLLRGRLAASVPASA